jgi:hypothetical protein
VLFKPTPTPPHPTPHTHTPVLPSAPASVPPKGIKVDPGYPAYDQGLREGVFMRGVDGNPYLAWVRGAWRKGGR